MKVVVIPHFHLLIFVYDLLCYMVKDQHRQSARNYNNLALPTALNLVL